MLITIIIETMALLLLFSMWLKITMKANDLRERLNKIIKMEINKPPDRLVRSVRIYRNDRQPIDYYDVDNTEYNGEICIITQHGKSLNITGVNNIRETMVYLKYDGKTGLPIYFD